MSADWKRSLQAPSLDLDDLGVVAILIGIGLGIGLLVALVAWWAGLALVALLLVIWGSRALSVGKPRS